MGPSLSDFEQQRTQLYQELSGTGDFQRGTVYPTRRRCGKPNCRCADPNDPGHGPRYLLSRSVDGKTQTRQLESGPELAKVTQEVSRYKEFVALSEQIVEVNEQLCDARPASPLAESEAPAEKEAKKGGSSRSSKKSLPQR